MYSRAFQHPTILPDVLVALEGSPVTLLYYSQHSGFTNWVHRMDANSVHRPELRMVLKPTDYCVSRSFAYCRASHGRLNTEIMVQRCESNVTGTEQANSFVRRFYPLSPDVPVLPRVSYVIQPQNHKINTVATIPVVIRFP